VEDSCHPVGQTPSSCCGCRCGPGEPPTNKFQNPACFIQLRSESKICMSFGSESHKIRPRIRFKYLKTWDNNCDPLFSKLTSNTMKLSLISIMMIGTPLTVGAFTVVGRSVPTHQRSVIVSLKAEVRPDTSELIKEAMAAAKQYGATSAEARLAWETVEEMDASTRTRYVCVCWGAWVSVWHTLRFIASWLLPL
jgi:hypothetical protein